MNFYIGVGPSIRYQAMEISEEKCYEILTQHSVRKTETRVQVLEVFFKYDYALAHSDVETALGDSFDRVTLYRTLHTFEQAGIIHEVPSQGETKFALGALLATQGDSYDQHIHFSCQMCRQTFCLENITPPQLDYSGDYTITSLSITAKGICKNCKGKN